MSKKNELTKYYKKLKDNKSVTISLIFFNLIAGLVGVLPAMMLRISIFYSIIGAVLLYNTVVFQSYMELYKEKKEVKKQISDLIEKSNNENKINSNKLSLKKDKNNNNVFDNNYYNDELTNNKPKMLIKKKIFKIIINKYYLMIKILKESNFFS